MITYSAVLVFCLIGHPRECKQTLMDNFTETQKCERYISNAALRQLWLKRNPDYEFVDAACLENPNH